MPNRPRARRRRRACADENMSTPYVSAPRDPPNAAQMIPSSKPGRLAAVPLRLRSELPLVASAASPLCPACAIPELLATDPSICASRCNTRRYAPVRALPGKVNRPRCVVSTTLRNRVDRSRHAACPPEGGDRRAAHGTPPQPPEGAEGRKDGAKRPRKYVTDFTDRHRAVHGTRVPQLLARGARGGVGSSSCPSELGRVRRRSQRSGSPRGQVRPTALEGCIGQWGRRP